jgi:NAD+ diphosphatase
MTFNETYTELIHAGAKLIILCADNIILQTAQDIPACSLENVTEEHWNSGIKYPVGLFNDNPLYVLEFSEQEASLYTTVPLKQYLETQDTYWFHMILRCKQLLAWHKNTFFCGSCGQPTQQHPMECAKSCTTCVKEIYPTVSPAIVVLIEKDTKILLSRPHHFRPGVYSHLAGFIEPGESAEQAILREVKEEVGITVKNIRYMGSQSWPFENSFMLAFIAE